MKILHLNTERGYRGGERQTILSLLGLRRCGHEPWLLCRAASPLAAAALAHGFSCYEARSHLHAAWLIVRHGGSFDCLHAQSSRIFGLVMMVRWFIRFPVVYTRRVCFAVSRRSVTWKYRRADAIIAISNAIAEVLHSQSIPVAAVIGSAVAGRTPDVVRAREFAASRCLNGRRVVGVVAALGNEKDPITMVRAAARVCQRLDDVTFCHFGSGPLESVVKEEIASRGLAGRYLLAGHLPDVEDFFELFSLFAMSSREEGLGSSVLDAFARGVPVVSTEAGGLRELVAGRGLLCPVGDDRALADAMVQLLGDPAGSASFVEAARNYVHREHGIEVVTGRNLEVYRRVV